MAQRFRIAVVNKLGQTVFKEETRRDQMANFFVNLPLRLIGMEACGGSHTWVPNKLRGLGQTAQWMTPNTASARRRRDP